jgi:hypothetical protein
VLLYSPRTGQLIQHRCTGANGLYHGMDQAIALSNGLMEASSALTSVAGRGGLNR